MLYLKLHGFSLKINKFSLNLMNEPAPHFIGRKADKKINVFFE